VPLHPHFTLSIYDDLFRKVSNALGIASLRSTLHTAHC
jgi:hypothetical protein